LLDFVGVFVDDFLGLVEFVFGVDQGLFQRSDFQFDVVEFENGFDELGDFCKVEVDSFDVLSVEAVWVVEDVFFDFVRVFDGEVFDVEVLEAEDGLVVEDLFDLVLAEVVVADELEHGFEDVVDFLGENGFSEVDGDFGEGAGVDFFDEVLRLFYFGHDVFELVFDLGFVGFDFFSVFLDFLVEDVELVFFLFGDGHGFGDLVEGLFGFFLFVFDFGFLGVGLFFEGLDEFLGLFEFIEAVLEVVLLGRRVGEFFVDEVFEDHDELEELSVGGDDVLAFADVEDVVERFHQTFDFFFVDDFVAQERFERGLEFLQDELLLAEGARFVEPHHVAVGDQRGVVEDDLVEVFVVEVEENADFEVLFDFVGEEVVDGSELVLLLELGHDGAQKGFLLVLGEQTGHLTGAEETVDVLHENWGDDVVHFDDEDGRAPFGGNEVEKVLDVFFEVLDAEVLRETDGELLEVLGRARHAHTFLAAHRVGADE